MLEINRFIMKLSWDSTDEEKKNAIESLLLIEDKDMHLLLQPLDKGVWDGAAEVIVRLGYPRVNVILPGLLVWLQDLNWPGAMRIADFLSEIGDPIVPHVRDVLKKHKEDEVWIYWLFEQIIDKWDKSKVSQIEEELIDISNGKINDLRAINTLFNHNVFNLVEVKRQLTNKIKGTIIELEELEKKYSGVDCIELERGFKEVLFKPELSRKYHEENKELFSYCGYKSYLQEYIREIEELDKEVSNFA
ncbi:DUF5071 domain-containing protein [Cohnella mopanensis]|uniref:DUF5071 domain-containing protein n=1 Tax=Cohnella mopanensis TaxID=2911966 RepID=UPI001EF76427|nr:DUF5071 domain-containing protein [Cohnella mopanensis]